MISSFLDFPARWVLVSMSFLGFGLHVVPGFANVGSGLFEIFMFLDFPNDAGFFNLPCVPDSSLFAVSFPLSSLLLFSISVSFVSLASLSLSVFRPHVLATLIFANVGSGFCHKWPLGVVFWRCSAKMNLSFL